MKILAILLPFICIITGVTSLTLGIYTYSRQQSYLVKNSLFFFICYTAYILIDASLNYFFINNYDFFISYRAHLHFFYIATLYIKMFSFTYFLNNLSNFKIKTKLNIIFAVLFIIIAIIDFRQKNYEFAINSITYISAVILFYPLILIPSINKMLTPANWISKKIVIIYIIFIPAFINIKFRLFSIFIPPHLHFIILSIIFIRFYFLFFLSKKSIESYNLTKRELEIVNLLQKGLSNAEISNLLHISNSTVKNHLYNTYKKLDVSNRFELIKKCS